VRLIIIEDQGPKTILTSMKVVVKTQYLSKYSFWDRKKAPTSLTI